MTGRISSPLREALRRLSGRGTCALAIRGAFALAGRGAFALALVTAWACGPLPSIEPPAPDEIETTVFLIGDAGEPDPRKVGAPLVPMREQAEAAPERSIILFLGDNVYPAGIPQEGAAEWMDSRRRLAAQVDAVPPGARGIFVPGNHDWGDAEAFGLQSIRLQEEMIASLAGERDVRLLPENGCPGPVPIDVGRLRIVALDTQWWLHNYIVRDAATECEQDVGAITAELRRQVTTVEEDRVVVVATHHPLLTGGEHGGYCGVTGIYHRFAGSSQDIISSANRRMRDSLESAFSGAPPLVFATAHDHNLQVLDGGPTAPFVLVSGAGSQSKVECAVWLRETYFASQYRTGFMRLDILRDGGVLLRVYHFTGLDDEGELAYSRWLEEPR